MKINTFFFLDTQKHDRLIHCAGQEKPDTKESKVHKV